MHKKTLLNVLILASLVFPAMAMAGEHQRDSWYIGFGIGAGIDEAWYVDGEKVTFDDWLGMDEGHTPIAFNFKVGGTISPKILLGFDATYIGESSSNGSSDRHASISNQFLMLTYFPWEEGFFCRTGGGFSNLDVEYDYGSYTVERSVDGYGLLVGIGYAFWLGKGFNLTVNIDHSRQFYDNDPYEPDRSKFTMVYLGFDWY